MKQTNSKIEKEINKILEAEEPKVYGDWKKFSLETKEELGKQLLSLISSVIDDIIGEDEEVPKVDGILEAYGNEVKKQQRAKKKELFE